MRGNLPGFRRSRPVSGHGRGYGLGDLVSPFETALSGEPAGPDHELDNVQHEEPEHESLATEGFKTGEVEGEDPEPEGEDPELESEGASGCPRCGRRQSLEAPEWEHLVKPLSSAARDYSLEGIAKGSLPAGVQAAILRDGEVDAYDLADRAFKAAHPEVTGRLKKTDKNYEKLSAEWGVMAEQVRALIWLRQVIDELDKTRGTLPRDFLLGWMAVESDGDVGTLTSRPERGYFQIDWLLGEAKEQLGLSLSQFNRLSTDRAFSIQQGVALANKYRQWILTHYPAIKDGTELLWRLTKCRHAASSTLTSTLDSLVKRKAAITWDKVSAEVPAFMRTNVNATLDWAAKLKPFADLVGSAAAPMTTPELFVAYSGDEESEAWESPNGSDGEASGMRDSGSLLDGEAESEQEPLLPGFVHEVLPQTLEENQTPAPKSLVLLDHSHVPKSVSTTTAGTFDIGSPAPLKTDDLNPLFIDASDNLVTDTSSTGLQTCLKALITGKYQDLLTKKGQTDPAKNDRVHVAVVDLTGNKLTAPDFAGWGSTVPIYGASVPKILALYGACQLRSDLRDMIGRLSPTSGVQLEKEAMKEWKAKGAQAPWPDLKWLFGINTWTPAATLDFTAAAQSAFADIMHNCPAGKLIVKVSFPFIASLAWQSALYHGTRGGLWLKSSYCGMGSWSSPVNSPYTHNATALAAATYFTLLAQGRLVDDASSNDIKTSLRGGCTTSLFPALPVVASKCGILAPYFHDCAWIEDTDVRYALAVMSRLDTNKHATLYTQLCKDIDKLVRNNNLTTKVAC